MKKVYRDRCLAVANMIEDHPHVTEDGRKLRLKMDAWITESGCGTTACMAGFAVMHKSRSKSWVGKIRDLFRVFAVEAKWDWWVHNLGPVPTEAAKYLGLSNYEARRLFLPDTNYSRITELRAAGVLRHFVKTGEIDWNLRRLPKREDVK